MHPTAYPLPPGVSAAPLGIALARLYGFGSRSNAQVLHEYAPAKEV